MKTNKAIAVPKLRFPEFKDNEGWKVKPLEKCASFINNKVELSKLDLNNYVSTENILQDFEGISRASKLPTTGKATEFKENDILISNIRPYLRKIWFSEFKGGASNDVLVLRANNNIDSLYLAFYLMTDSFINYVMTGAKGVKMPRGDISQIRQYDIAYPSPVEQQKIADCLSCLDALIKAESEQLDALKSHKTGLLQQLFPADGETVPKLRFGEFKDDRDWEVSPLGERGAFTGGGTPSKSKPSYWEGSYPWISSSDISEDSIYKVNITRYITKKAIEQSATKKVPKDSILLLSRVGIGKLAISRHSIYTSQDFTSFTPRNDNLLFIAYQLKANSYKFLDFSQGMGIQGFTKEDISNFLVATPSLREQQKIANCLSSLDKLIQSKTNKIEALKHHKQGLMQQLFPSSED